MLPETKFIFDIFMDDICRKEYVLNMSFMTFLVVSWLCITLYDFLWLCMTLYDSVWLCMTLYDSVWLCMTLYDSAWLCITLFDNAWLYMIMFDSVWLTIISRGRNVRGDICPGGTVVLGDTTHHHINTIFNPNLNLTEQDYQLSNYVSPHLITAFESPLQRWVWAHLLQDMSLAQLSPRLSPFINF